MTQIQKYPNSKLTRISQMKKIYPKLRKISNYKKCPKLQQQIQNFNFQFLKLSQIGSNMRQNESNGILISQMSFIESKLLQNSPNDY